MRGEDIGYTWDLIDEEKEELRMRTNILLYPNLRRIIGDDQEPYNDVYIDGYRWADSMKDGLSVRVEETLT